MDYDPKDLQSVLSYMRGRFGADVFEESRYMLSVLLDLSPELKRDGNVLRQMSEEGLLRELRAAVDTGGGNELQRVIMKSRYWLTDYLQLSDERADFYVTALKKAYGLAVEPPRNPQPVTPPAQFFALPTQPAPPVQSVTPPAQPAPQKPIGNVIDSGRTGDCTWTLDSNGVLTIYGFGKMENYGPVGNLPPWRIHLSEISSVIIQNGVTHIGNKTFENCASLTSVNIPNSVTQIGNFAFSGCKRLRNVNIPNGVMQIGDFAFMECTSLISVNIPNSVMRIGGCAFMNCNSLIIVNISNSVTQIGAFAFSGCKGLTIVYISNSVTQIGQWAFLGCTSLTSVNIPDSVTQIGQWAFFECQSLTHVSVPRGAKIERDTFDRHTRVLTR